MLQLDMMDLASVKAAAARYTSEETRLDILINNAGVNDFHTRIEVLIH